MGIRPWLCFFLLGSLYLSSGEATRLQGEESALATQVAGTLKKIVQFVAKVGANSSAPQSDIHVCDDMEDVTNNSTIQLQAALKAWPHGKLWVSKNFNAKWLKEVGHQRPPGFQQGTNFQDIIQFISRGQPLGVTVKGGAVRDLFLDGVTPMDIDIGWSNDTESLKNAMQAEFRTYCDNPEGEWGEQFQYLQFGIKETGPGASPFDPLEGNHKKAFSVSECKPENSVNALEFEPVQQIIIDPTGFGVTDACSMKFRLPPDCKSALKWVSINGGQTALRFYKMYQKGFKIAHHKDLYFLFQSLDLQARNAVGRQDRLAVEAKEFFIELKRNKRRIETKKVQESLEEEMKQAVFEKMVSKIDAIGAAVKKGYADATDAIKSSEQD